MNGHGMITLEFSRQQGWIKIEMSNPDQYIWGAFTAEQATMFAKQLQNLSEQAKQYNQSLTEE